MNNAVILLRYGELALKSPYVRKQFESTLLHNIKKALIQENIPHKLTKERGRIYLTTEEISKSLQLLSRIFGIVSFSPAIQTITDLDTISNLSLKFIRPMLTKGTSFGIRATRIGTHPFTSQDVAIRIGNDVVSATHAPVDLSHPDVELFIEIRENRTFLFTEKRSGIGGLPLGTQGKVLACITNSASLLAAWYLMRRGCNIVFVTTKQSNDDGIHAFLSYWYVHADIVIVDPTSQQYTKHLCEIASKYDCDAIVTGHSLQDLPDGLSAIAQMKKQCDLPILTPLIAVGEKEIKNQCQRRGIEL
jgi:adenylyl- and sulfurtransferase ThiI